MKFFAATSLLFLSLATNAALIDCKVIDVDGSFSSMDGIAEPGLAFDMTSDGRLLVFDESKCRGQDFINCLGYAGGLFVIFNNSELSQHFGHSKGRLTHFWEEDEDMGTHRIILESSNEITYEFEDGYEENNLFYIDLNTGRFEIRGKYRNFDLKSGYTSQTFKVRGKCLL